MNWKELAKTAAISLAVVAAYHNGILNFVPVFTGAKK